MRTRPKTPTSPIKIQEWMPSSLPRIRSRLPYFKPLAMEQCRTIPSATQPREHLPMRLDHATLFFGIVRASPEIALLWKRYGSGKLRRSREMRTTHIGRQTCRIKNGDRSETPVFLSRPLSQIGRRGLTPVLWTYINQAWTQVMHVLQHHVVPLAIITRAP